MKLLIVSEKFIALRYTFLNFPTDVYLSLNGDIIPNHGYVDISDVGSTDATALLCYTNRNPPPGSTISGRNWLVPDGKRVPNEGVPGFNRNRGPMVVRLRRNIATDPAAQGIYQCIALNADGNKQIVHVGLYNSGKGKLRVE